MTYRVHYTEYERGWGSRPEGYDDFDTLEEANKRVKSFNAHNSEKHPPDWYMVAHEPVLVESKD